MAERAVIKTLMLELKAFLYFKEFYSPYKRIALAMDLLLPNEMILSIGPKGINCTEVHDNFRSCNGQHRIESIKYSLLDFTQQKSSNSTSLVVKMAVA